MIPFFDWPSVCHHSSLHSSQNTPVFHNFSYALQDDNKFNATLWALGATDGHLILYTLNLQNCCCQNSRPKESSRNFLKSSFLCTVNVSSNPSDTVFSTSLSSVVKLSLIFCLSRLTCSDKVFCSLVSPLAWSIRSDFDNKANGPWEEVFLFSPLLYCSNPSDTVFSTSLCSVVKLSLIFLLESLNLFWQSFLLFGKPSCSIYQIWFWKRSKWGMRRSLPFFRCYFIATGPAI